MKMFSLQLSFNYSHGFCSTSLFNFMILKILHYNSLQNSSLKNDYCFYNCLFHVFIFFFSDYSLKQSHSFLFPIFFLNIYYLITSSFLHILSTLTSLQEGWQRKARQFLCSILPSTLFVMLVYFDLSRVDSHKNKGLKLVTKVKLLFLEVSLNDLTRKMIFISMSFLSSFFISFFPSFLSFCL